MSTGRGRGPVGDGGGHARLSLAGEYAPQRASKRHIAHQLRAEILSGKLPAGARLPSEAHLMRRFPASRVTVRAAIAQLRAEGLIVTVHGLGSIVRAAATGASVVTVGTWPITASPGGPWREVAPQQPVTMAVDALCAEAGAWVLCRVMLLEHRDGPRLLQRWWNAPAPDGTRPVPEPSDLGTGTSDAAAAVTTRARMPCPQERTLLGLPEGTPALVMR